MATEALPDRRQRRRYETIEEALDVAADVMAEHGVAGLSVGEVARRMGIRPPSLYVYFASKNALYDALFARGWRLIRDAMQPLYERLATDTDLDAFLGDVGSVFVRWAIEHPAYSQLMFWRPVPGYAPTPEAYAAAVEVMDQGRAVFGELQRRGFFRADAAIDEILKDWTIVINGVISQQLANAPHQGFEDGTFTSQLPRIVAMFRAYNAPPARPAHQSRRGRARTR
jgi:AcrR family transcriptional regulator